MLNIVNNLQHNSPTEPTNQRNRQHIKPTQLINQLEEQKAADGAQGREPRVDLEGGDVAADYGFGQEAVHGHAFGGGGWVVRGGDFLVVAVQVLDCEVHVEVLYHV
jgi:hypothetical protein